MGREVFYCQPGDLLRKTSLDEETNFWVAPDGRLLRDGEVAFQPPLIPAALGMVAATAEGGTSENP